MKSWITTTFVKRFLSEIRGHPPQSPTTSPWLRQNNLPKLPMSLTLFHPILVRSPRLETEKKRKDVVDQLCRTKRNFLDRESAKIPTLTMKTKLSEKMLVYDPKASTSSSFLGEEIDNKDTFSLWQHLIKKIVEPSVEKPSVYKYFWYHLIVYLYFCNKSR